MPLHVSSLRRSHGRGVSHVIAGRYTLEREIGRGGAGIVHLAHDEVLNRSVAIKRIGLLPGIAGHDIARAQREARIAAGINHPHVVSIFDLVKDEDCYWLVMELVEGRTLAELVTDEGPLRPTRAAGILAQAADALVQADRAGIVHRDVKPSNIMVNDANHAKLGDFGIARATSDAALTQTGLVTGSPAFLAPEVASGTPASGASDVWSLGSTLFYTVTGRPPYEVGENVLGGLYKIVHDEPPQLPDDHPLAALLAVMMVKDPTQRWPVERVRDDLRRIARGERSSAVGVEPPPDRHEGDATTVWGTPMMSPPAEPTDSATLTSPVARAPAPPPAADSSDSRSRAFPLGWIAALLALVLVAGYGAWLLWPGDGERPDAATNTAATEQTEQPPSEQSTASDDPTEDPTEEPVPTPEPAEEPTVEPPVEPSQAAAGQGAVVRSLVENYFALATSDPESSFAMLTPQFQAQTGGFGRYSGFWSTISSATPYDISVDLSAPSASYTVEYVTTSGRTTTEQKLLLLERQGDSYLIAGDG